MPMPMYHLSTVKSSEFAIGKLQFSQCSLLDQSRNARNGLFSSLVQKTGAGIQSGLPVLISLIMEIWPSVCQLFC